MGPTSDPESWSAAYIGLREEYDLKAVDEIQRLMPIAKEDLPAGTDIGEAVYSEKGRSRFINKSNLSFAREQILLARLKLAGYKFLDHGYVIEDPVALADYKNKPLPEVIEELKKLYATERKEAFHRSVRLAKVEVSTKVD